MEPFKILIVEDNPLEAEEMRLFAEHAGYAVTEICKTGESALSSLKREKPDLVLLDIHLAGELDGLETAGVVKKSWGIPVVFLTSDPGRETLSRIKSSPGDFFLPKPFNDLQFKTAIEFSLIESELNSDQAPRPMLHFNQHFFFFSDGAYRKVSISDILYIEGARDKSMIHLNGKKNLQVNVHLKVIENLHHPDLIRVHRSLIVNRMEVDAVLEKSYLLLSDGKKIVFSQTYLPNPAMIFPIVKNS